MIEGNARWIAYLVISAMLGILVAVRSTKYPRRQDVVKFLIVISAVIPLSVGSLFRRWTGVGHEGANFLDQSLSPAWLELVFATIIVLSYSILRGFRLTSSSGVLLVIAQTALLVLSLFNTRIGDAILTRPGHIVTFLCCVFLLGFLTSRMFVSGTFLSGKNLSRSTLIVLVALALAMSMRIDGLQTPGSWFHVGYFTGVIQTIQNGGILLWDTPSQYGFANMLLASIVPASTAERSFLIFQALAMMLVYVVVLLMMRKTLPTRQWALLGAVFLILLYLTDPAMHGPQPYPSTSAVRFGPSLICLAMFSGLNDLLESRRRRWFVATFLAVACLWSFESAFYTALILSAWVLGHLLNSTDRRPRVFSVAKLLSSWFGSLILFSIAYSLWVFSATGELPSWQYLAIFPREYAKGFGALPTDLFGSIWIFLLAMLCCALPIARSRSREWPTLFASVGALVGWLSYYIGRSHSSNVLNMIPLVFAAVVFAATGVSNESQGNSASDSEVINNLRLLAPVFLVAVGAVIVSTVVSSPQLPTIVSNARPLPLEAIYDPDSESPEELNELLRSIPLQRLPIAYQGNLAMLPRLAPDVAEYFDLEATWLPLPIRLLEPPIPVEIRRVVLDRFSRREKRSGYFIWHKGNSLPGYGEEWLEDLQASFSCTKAGESDNWQVLLCRLHKS